LYLATGECRHAITRIARTHTQASQLNWKNGQAQGFALFTAGAYARAACDAITQLA